MKKNILEVPVELQDAQSDIHASLCNNMGHFSTLLYEPCDILIKTKLLCVAVMMMVKEPVFTKETSLDTLSIPELVRIEKTYDFENIMDLEYAYKAYCTSIMDSLCMFGWKTREPLFFSKEDEPLATYRNTYLHVYSEYFDELVDKEDASNDFEANVYTFVNERLGKYQSYANTHTVKKELSIQITFELGQITNLFGASLSVNSLRDYGYEVVYIHSRDVDQDDYGDRCYENVNFLMPIHAANLEKLLDIAYELYPIESEGKNHEGRRTN